MERRLGGAMDKQIANGDLAAKTAGPKHRHQGNSASGNAELGCDRGTKRKNP
jgi:hypothetical protein